MRCWRSRIHYVIAALQIVSIQVGRTTAELTASFPISTDSEAVLLIARHFEKEIFRLKVDAIIRQLELWTEGGRSYTVALPDGASTVSTRLSERSLVVSACGERVALHSPLPPLVKNVEDGTYFTAVNIFTDEAVAVTVERADEGGQVAARSATACENHTVRNGAYCKIGRHRLLPLREWENRKECTHCSCDAEASLTCGRMGCAPVNCSSPVLSPGECCPRCLAQCTHEDKVYEHGMKFFPSECVECECSNGIVSCDYIKPDACPQLSCNKTVQLPNRCCPQCAEEENCAARPCDAVATCTNGAEGPICRCPLGFIGNGRTCFDIDECKFNELIREQLGICSTGTTCVNTPGSFRCPCLPGFLRFNNLTCLSLLRV